MQERRKSDRRRPLPTNEEELIGRFCRTADGQRVLVESVRFTQSDGSTLAVYQYMEGPHKGKIGNCPSSSLEILGKVIPVQDEKNMSNSAPEHLPLSGSLDPNKLQSE